MLLYNRYVLAPFLNNFKSKIEQIYTEMDC